MQLPFSVTFLGALLLCLAPVAVESTFCRRPSVPVHGRHDKLSWKYFKPGTIVKFSCNPGYKLEGSSTSKCIYKKFVFTRYLVWSPAVPKCVQSKACAAKWHAYCLIPVVIFINKKNQDTRYHSSSDSLLACF